MFLISSHFFPRYDAENAFGQNLVKHALLKISKNTLFS